MNTLIDIHSLYLFNGIKMHSGLKIERDVTNTLKKYELIMLQLREVDSLPQETCTQMDSHTPRWPELSVCSI